MPGILNLRGTFISVIDFRSAMDSDSSANIETGMVLVVIAGDRFCGFLVDNITDVFDHHESRVIPIPGLKDHKRIGCLRGVVPVSEDRNVFLNDSKALKTLAAEISEVDEIISFPTELMEPPGSDGYIRGMLSLRESLRKRTF
ncbi:chemotaxis protein CheW [Pelagicoccus sp. SDUM812002]|uniref:chemotaxis protein CheW n=1 Tax=Pelagicoccus sp. SDUM812002 TaxID=3041266 RepID=UPI00280D5A13|nr:chemotaxis protein CheW [Pelagicoccus sp. SDUM812002]MDQ8184442.1 chemotaxis protein CheW [Pelagicoccus sp. SDUM812002]